MSDELHRRAAKRTLAKALRRAAPDAMAMGTTGMADMAEMAMPLPANTLPMMTGTGQFGAIEMGGMFTMVKVREGLAAATIAIRAGTSIQPAPSPTRSMPPWPDSPPGRRVRQVRAKATCRPE